MALVIEIRERTWWQDPQWGPPAWVLAAYSPSSADPLMRWLWWCERHSYAELAITLGSAEAGIRSAVGLKLGEFLGWRKETPRPGVIRLTDPAAAAVAQVSAWTVCLDCRGTGEYRGLAVVENCRACGGTGRA